MRNRSFIFKLLALGAAAAVVGTGVLAQMIADQDDLEGYLGWTRLNAQRNFIESAHEAPKDVYVNDLGRLAATELQFPFPEGTVLVKETTDEEQLRVAVITAMRKVAGFDPDNNDWQYGMFERQDDGSFGGTWAEVGSDMHQMCVGCHTGAQATDFAFLNYID